MKEAGASTDKIELLENILKSGVSFSEALKNDRCSTLCSAVFGLQTIRWHFIGKPHEIAASFTLGREELIPDLFSATGQ